MGRQKKKKGKKSSVPRPMNTIHVRLAAVFELRSGRPDQGTDPQPVNATLFTRSLKEAYRGSSIQATAGPDLPLNNYDKFYSVWDLFRVNKVHIHFVPTYQYEEYNLQSPQEVLPPLIISHDYDNSKNYEVKNQLGDAQTKMRDPTRPFKLTFTIPHPPGEAVDTWQNCQEDIGARFQEGIISINSLQPLKQNAVVGNMYVTYECSFKERQDTKILPTPV